MGKKEVQSGPPKILIWEMKQKLWEQKVEIKTNFTHLTNKIIETFENVIFMMRKKLI